ncbi:hypothetical protein [Zunongwangia atlantica]|uniref:Uncharacterized protein n=1 Tax=Zunongwangia atlantica 22II14-10F7 TaxID=1185767 RepID=A0A1Y1SZ96_9FLAO|nr:hypothetical protein [Zunongwangia atlantica]ORL44079.1 hypothetical protein IIF7_17847 [Zunongwangia atlantica 22II14-10F7]
MKRIFLLVMLFSMMGSFAQSSSYNLGVNYNAGIPYRNIGNKVVADVDFEGSPYIEDTFVKGRILSDDEKNGREVFMRFNYVNNLVEIKLDENQEKSSFIPRVSDIKYDFGNYRYVLKEVKDVKNGKTLDIYYIEFYNNEDDKIKFIAYPELEIVDNSGYTTGYEKRKPNIIKPNLKYFVQNGNKLTEIRLKAKDFKNLFSDKSKMESYFKENKIKDEQDVVAMLEFYAE